MRKHRARRTLLDILLLAVLAILLWIWVLRQEGCGSAWMQCASALRPYGARPGAAARGSPPRLAAPDAGRDAGPAISPSGVARKYDWRIPRDPTPIPAAQLPPGKSVLAAGLPPACAPVFLPVAQTPDFSVTGAQLGARLLPAALELRWRRKPAGNDLALRMRFVGANPDAKRHAEESEGRRHYYIGPDRTRWLTNAPCFAQLVYENLYPGIDLVYRCNRDRLECDFRLATDADPACIRLAFDGVDRVASDAQGALHISAGGTTLMYGAPCLHGTERVETRPLLYRYVVDGSTVRIERQERGLAAREEARTALTMVSFLGGAGDEEATAVAVDQNGYAYVAGTTTAPGFPSRETGERTLPDDITVFVTKFRLADARHIYTAFIGGAAQDHALAVAADRDGNAYVCGETRSADFPVTAGATPADGGGSWDVFVARVNPDGSRLDSVTRLGGRDDDHAYGIALDAATNIYVAGETRSADLTGMARRFGPAVRGWDAFVTRLHGTDGAEPATILIGGTGDDAAYAIAVDDCGAVCLAGQTSSRDFPTVAALQPHHGGGEWDAFAARLSPSGSALAYATYLGGANDDRGHGLALDAAGRACIVGETSSPDFPLADPMQSRHAGGNWDIFLAALSDDGTRLAVSTFYGGAGDDRAFAIAVDQAGNAHVAGTTSSTNFPAVNAWQPDRGGDWDGLALGCDLWKRRVLYSSCLGAPGENKLCGVAVDVFGNPCFCGHASAVKLPVRNALQARPGGSGDALLARLAFRWAALPALCTVRGGGQPDGPEYDYYMGKFEIANEEFLRFLNDAEAHPGTPLSAHMFFGSDGDIWFHPAQDDERHELFRIRESRLVYRRDLPVGRRYGLVDSAPEPGGSYADHPVTGVSWFGAVKYCNWLTLASGLREGERCYREGTDEADWAPVAVPAADWSQGRFPPAARRAWLARKGFRLPMDAAAGTTNAPNAFNEFYKAAAWNGITNLPYGFGRLRATRNDANFLDHGLLARHDTTPVGFYDGRDSRIGFGTSPDANAYGLRDLSGNVAEWMNDPGVEGSLADRACAGGSWMGPLPQTTERAYVHPWFTDRFRGFRVVTTCATETERVIRSPCAIRRDAND